MAATSAAKRATFATCQAVSGLVLLLSALFLHWVTDNIGNPNCRLTKTRTCAKQASDIICTVP
eukprot:1203638-Amphidinium_carterae.1